MADPILVFDLDGTLVHTAPDLIDSLNHALGHAGLETESYETLLGFLGHGGRAMIRESFARQQRHLPDELLENLYRLFLDHYTAGIPGKSLPFPGAVERIAAFSKAGFKHAICTNKHEKSAKALLGGLQLDHHFRAITGQDTFGFNKPDPRHLTETIAMAGGDPTCAIMVGDSVTDIKTAKAAGIPVIAVDFGYTAIPVRELEPDLVISHFDEMTDYAVEALLARRPA